MRELIKVEQRKLIVPHPSYSELDPLNRDDRDRLAMLRAINMSFESANKHGIDLPIGAVALSGEFVVGSGFASDRLLADTLPNGEAKKMHAEIVALEAALSNPDTPNPTEIAVTLEPCDNCQDILCEAGIERILYGLPRSAAEDMNLIKRHDVYIDERNAALGLGFEVAQVEDPWLEAINLGILACYQRDKEREVVSVDRDRVRAVKEHANGRQQVSSQIEPIPIK